jgi:hypothetical protein
MICDSVKTYSIGLLLLSVFCPFLCFAQNWTVNPTGITHTILIPPNLQILGNNQNENMMIGAFYTTGESELCVGKTMFESGKGTSLTIYGETESILGMPKDSLITLKIWLAGQSCQVETVEAEYATPNNVLVTSTNIFIPDGISRLSKVGLTKQEVGYPKDKYCYSDSVATPSVILESLSYSSMQSGLTLNSETGEIELQKSEKGFYTIRFDSELCLTNDSAILRIDSESIQFSSNEVEGCGLANIQLTNDSLFNITWSNGGSGNKISISESGEYQVSAITSSGCLLTASANATIFPYPIYEPLQDTSLCQPYEVNFDNDLQVLWSDNDNSNQKTFNFPGGDFWVEITNEFACTVIDSIEIDIRADWVLELEDSVFSCDGIIEIEPSISGNIQNPIFLWSNGDTSNYTEVEKTGNVGLIVSDGSGLCQQSDTAYITINKSPDFEKINHKTTNPSCAFLGKVELISQTDIQNYTLILNAENKGKSPIFNELEAGSYTLEFAIGKNCIYEYPQEILLEKLEEDCDKNLIYPDDGIKLKCDNIEIYNRSGSRVFQHSGSIEWSGLDNYGRLLPVGYYIVYCNGQFFRGVTLGD